MSRKGVFTSFVGIVFVCCPVLQSGLLVRSDDEIFAARR